MSLINSLSCLIAALNRNVEEEARDHRGRWTAALDSGIGKLAQGKDAYDHLMNHDGKFWISRDGTNLHDATKNGHAAKARELLEKNDEIGSKQTASKNELMKAMFQRGFAKVDSAPDGKSINVEHPSGVSQAQRVLLQKVAHDAGYALSESNGGKPVDSKSLIGSLKKDDDKPLSKKTFVQRWMGEDENGDPLKVDVAKEVGDAIKSGKHTAFSKMCVDGIRDGSSLQDLHRGFKTSDQEILKYEPGQKIQVMPGSFSTDESLAHDYATGSAISTFHETQAKAQGKRSSVMLHISAKDSGGKIKGMKMPNWYDQPEELRKEFITGGKFQVTKTEDEGKIHHIYLKQKGTF